MPAAQDETAAQVTMYEDGPLLLRGSFQIFDQDGLPIDAGRPTVALCRCGKSAIKPFCDGTHKTSSFRASGRRDDPARRPAVDDASAEAE
jgi:CDGSH-type Zn-finger protein